MSDPVHDGAKNGAVILVVDDERLNRDLLERMLRRQGHRCVPAASAAEAFEALRAERFDLVLLDMLLPDTTGLTFLDALRILGHLPDLPVIVLTGLDDDGAREEAFRRGAVDFLAKPILRVQLYEAIDCALAGRARPQPRHGATEG